METTIPSYLTARPSQDLRRAADQASTLAWWATKRQEYELFASAAVHQEAAKGDPEMAAARLLCLQGIPYLPSPAEADELSEHLLESGIIPEVAMRDATHIALSAVHRMDFLLTWNCKHINNPHIIRRIEKSCAERGLACPVICTPSELLRI
ncbi:MAG TPA: type II toxin-antitoxin system VapC family toxin [Chthoniobacteraceae bacterium]|nr:type II toxin-antitoxin system VapC family toxin [Chthoniobacteraceae bacterium]